jgi:hypothetical protein
MCACVAPALAHASTPQAQHPVRVAVHAEADFDGDGILDRASLSPASREIAIRFSGAPVRHIALLEPASSLAVMDMDRDGDLDIVALARSPRLQVWLNGGSGEFRPRAIAPERSLLSPLSRLAADAANVSPAPALRLAALSGAAPVQHRAVLVEMSAGGTGVAFSVGSSRAPPASL